MDVESELWPQWETSFNELASQAQKVKKGPQIGSAKHFLCLYGDNGLSGEDEFEELEKLKALHEADPANLKKVEVDAGYWQDVILFVL